MSVLASKPNEWFVLPDPKLRGQSNVVSATSQSGAYPGPTSPLPNNKGLMFPLQAGDLTSLAEPIRYSIARAGGIGVGEFGWRRLSDATDQFRGMDDVRRFWGYHAPFTGTVGSDNCATAFCLPFRRLVCCNIDDATSPNPVRIRYRDIDTDRYDEWTEVTFNLTNAVAAGHHHAQLIDLPDGRLMLVVRVASGPDFDVYHSDDGGLTWRLVSDGIIATFNPSSGLSLPTHDLDSQFRVARSGEYIRLVWMTATANARTFLSTDRGISWQRLEDQVGTYTDTGHTDDPIPFTLCAVDDTSGTFILQGLSSPSLTTSNFATGTGAQPWFNYGNPTAQAFNVKQLVGVRTPEYVYVFTFFSDTGVSTNDGYAVARCRPSAASDLLNTSGVGWEFLSEMQRFDTGIRYAPGRLSACWFGSGIFFYGARRDSTGGYTDINLPLAWYHGGWTRRSLWRARPTLALGSLGAALYGRFWSTECDAPDVPAGSPWTVVGTGTVVTNMDEVAISSTPGNLRRYNRTIAAAGGPSWGQENDTCFGWTVKTDTGDGALFQDETAVRIFSENTANTTRLDVSVRMAPGGLRVRDNNAGVDLDTISTIAFDTGPTGRYFEVRWAMFNNGGTFRGQAAVLDHDTGIWEVGANVILTSAAAGGSNEVRFGQLVAPAAGTARSYWRDFWVCENGDAHQETFDNPDDIVGYPMQSTEAVYIEHGLLVQWGGLGGGLSDTFDGSISYAHGAGQVAIDSPRIDWRSTSIAAQTLIFDADPVNGVNRWVHDAIGLFGCNDRTVLVDYDSDVNFGSPSALKTVDFTRFGTGTTALVAFIPLGTTLLLVPATTTQFVKGDLVGLYIRVTSGPALGRTWKVTRHDARDVLYFDEETTDLLAQGLLPGNTMVVFSPNAVLSYPLLANERYMRLRFLDADTAEGDHRCGTVVCGSRQDIDVPLDWSKTDNEQPNLTQMRTRGAVQWYYEEGPPQRTWTGRIVGDVTQRHRDELRGLLRSVGYESRPIAFVFDGERPADACALVRWMGGNQQDNQGYFRDANGVIRTLGDLSVTLVEEV